MKFSLKTREGCKALLALLLVITLVFGFVGILFESDFCKVKSEQISIDYRGGKLTGELFYPWGTNSHDNLPAIIVAHGGANSFGVAKNFSNEFARRGYVVFAFSAYGQGHSEHSGYDDGDQGLDGYNNRATPAGFLDAYNYVKSITFVDETRIGVIGHSMGSYRADQMLLQTANYLSLNDIMINVMSDELGITFEEDEIYEDAAALAAEKLDDTQLQYFNYRYEEELADYSDKVISFIVTGIDRAEINTVQTFTVGGYEVQRCAKVNLGFIDGEYDEFVFDFGTHDHEQQGWYSTVPMTVDKYYNLDDQNETNEIIGTFEQDTVLNNAALAQAIENRTLRVFHVSPGEDHCKETISVKTNAAMIEFFTQTLGYNCGELSDPNTVPMDNYDSIFAGRVAANAVTVLAFLGIVVVLAAYISHNEKGIVPVIELGESKKTKFTKSQYWLFAVVTFVAATYIFRKANKNWFAIAPPFFGKYMIPLTTPLSKPACITLFFFMFVALVDLIAMVGIAIWQKARGEKLGIAALNINIPIGKILKYFVYSLLVVVVGYTINGALTYLFGQDLRVWQNAFSYVNADQWYLVAKNTLLFMPLMFISACATNYMVRDDRPEWLDTLIVVLINGAPIALLCLVSAIVLNVEAKFTGTFVCDFVCAYSFVTAVPMFTYLNRKLYKLTNSVWLGTFVCSILLGWLLVNTLGTGDGYYGQTILNTLFGC